MPLSKNKTFDYAAWRREFELGKKIKGNDGEGEGVTASSLKRAKTSVQRRDILLRAQSSFVEHMEKRSADTSFGSDPLRLGMLHRSLARNMLPASDKVLLAQSIKPHELKRAVTEVAIANADSYTTPAEKLHEFLFRETGVDSSVDLGTGLSTAQAQKSMDTLGKNELPNPKPPSVWRLWLLQFAEPTTWIILLIFVQACYSLADGYAKNGTGNFADWFTFAILFAILFFATLLTALAQVKSGDALAQLAAVGSVKCMVLRDGSKVEVEANEIVVGDVVFIGTGDTIPADLRCVEATDLQCVESALTGEPNEVKKSTALPKAGASDPFPSNVLFSSTSVVNGRGTGVVIAVGTNTVVGQIAQKIGDLDQGKSPLEKVMTRLGGIIICVIVALIIAFTVVLALTEQVDPSNFGGSVWLAATYEGFNMATVIVPSTLPLAVLLSMNHGVQSLSKLGAQMRRFTAVETLGAATVICSDKTGTLTEGKMTAVAITTASPAILKGKSDATLHSYALVPSRGFNPFGGVFDETQSPSTFAKEEDSLGPKLDGALNYGSPSNGNDERAQVVRAALAATLINCGETRVMKKGDGYEAVGNMSEAALVVGAAKAGFWRGKPGDVEAVDAATSPAYSNPADTYGAIGSLEVPFSSSRKMKATVHSVADGSFMGIHLPQGAAHFAVVKGAPDRLLPFIDPGEDAGAFARLAAMNEEYAARGLRVLFTCFRVVDETLLGKLRDAEDADARLECLLDESNPLQFLVMFGLMDPPREGVKDSIAHIHGAGVKVVMITGDQLSTAASISEQIGILPKGSIDSIESSAESTRMCADLHEDPSDPAGSPFVEPEIVNAYSKQVAAWARAQPMDKVRIVESLAAQGETTVMTGDGVNDSAALKASDIGVSMGITGTDVAKGAADMILMDDNFVTIVRAVEEGRRIFGNLQKFLLYYLGTKACEVFLFSICTFAAIFSPVGGLRGLLAAMALTFSTPLTILNQPAEPYQMHIAPRPKKMFLGPLTARICIYRILPMILIYQLCIMTPSFIGKTMYTGNLKKIPTSDSWHSYVAQETNCIVAHRLTSDSFTGGKGWTVKDGYAIGVNPVACHCPEEQTFGAAFSEQFGAVNGASLASSDGAFNKEVAAEFNFTYSDYVWDGSTGSMYAANNSGGMWEAHYGIDKVAGLSFDGVRMLEPCDSDNYLCWTDAAIAKYGDDAAAYPQIASDFSCGQWGLQKSNTIGWYAFVWGELSVVLSVRSESPFWRASHIVGKGASAPNYALWISVVASVIYTFIVASVPGIRAAIQCLPIPFGETMMVAAFIFLMLILNDAVKLFVYYPKMVKDNARRMASLSSTQQGAQQHE